MEERVETELMRQKPEFERMMQARADAEVEKRVKILELQYQEKAKFLSQDSPGGRRTNARGRRRMQRTESGSFMTQVSSSSQGDEGQEETLQQDLEEGSHFRYVLPDNWRYDKPRHTYGSQKPADRSLAVFWDGCRKEAM